MLRGFIDFGMRVERESEREGGRGRGCVKRGLVLSSGSFLVAVLPEMMADRVKEEGEASEFFSVRAIRPRVCGRFLSAG